MYLASMIKRLVRVTAHEVNSIISRPASKYETKMEMSYEPIRDSPKSIFLITLYIYKNFIVCRFTLWLENKVTYKMS